MCKRGDIYYADFGVKMGSCEQGGIRPAVVVSNNKANANSPVITVVPLTTKIWKKPYLPTHVQIPYSVTTGLQDKVNCERSEQDGEAFPSFIMRKINTEYSICNYDRRMSKCGMRLEAA